MRRLYMAGRSQDGWRCINCDQEFAHENPGALWTFIGLVIHTLVRHHRLPRYIGETVTTWRFTYWIQP